MSKMRGILSQEEKAGEAWRKLSIDVPLSLRDSWRLMEDRIALTLGYPEDALESLRPKTPFAGTQNKQALAIRIEVWDSLCAGILTLKQEELEQLLGQHDKAYLVSRSPRRDFSGGESEGVAMKIENQKGDDK